MCLNMDTDGSGYIDKAEFKEFWSTSTELQHQLTVMGILESDIDGLLKLMDRDGDGLLNHKEFVEELTKMRSLVLKTSVYQIYRFSEHMFDIVCSNKDHVEHMQKDLASLKA